MALGRSFLMVLGLALAAALLTAAAPGSRPGATESGVDDRARADRARTLVVDRNSLGGRCDDRRKPEHVSARAPLCSLERALTLAPAAARTTVVVRQGTYPELEIVDRARSRQLTFRTAPRERPTLDGIMLERSSYVAFEGFRITDVPYFDQAWRIALSGNDISPHGIKVEYGRELAFENNVIHDLRMDRGEETGYGLRIVQGWDILVRDNQFRRIPGDGIQAGRAYRYVIEDNLFEQISPFIDPDVHSDSIQFYGGSEDVTIRGNVIRQARGPIIDGRSKSAPNVGLVIENNLLVHLNSWSLNIYNAPGLVLANNTVWDTGSSGVAVGNVPGVPVKSRDVVVVNNILQRFKVEDPGILAYEDYNLIAEGYRAGEYDLTEPPRFVDADALDYRLAEGSPGVDAGTSIGTPDHDLLDAPRVDSPSSPNTGGGAKPYYDIGTLERQVR